MDIEAEIVAWRYYANRDLQNKNYRAYRDKMRHVRYLERMARKEKTK